MDGRLESWKEIAAYLGREVRTAQRWALARNLPVHRLPGGDKPRVFSTRPEIDAWLQAGGPDAGDGPVSVAVLPFMILGGAPEDQYFGDGLADDVINALVRIPGLRVTARTSSFAYAGRGHDVRDIGARLRATWLIEGSVRHDRDRVRVSVQLVNARDGFHAWSECFDRQLTDVFAIQDGIASAVAQALEMKLAPHAPVLHRADPIAYTAWLKGRSISQQFTPRALAEACECYEAAIERDPSFARPYFGLAELLFQGIQFGLPTLKDPGRRAREAIARSLELDDHFGEAHALMGVLRGVLNHDWTGAEAAFRRALELSPGSAAVLMQHAWFHLLPRRQVSRAIAHAREAVALDPLSPLMHGRLGLVVLAAGDYAAAVEECGTALQLAPGLWWLHWFYGTALLMHGEIEDGFRHAREAYERVHQPIAVGALALLCGRFHRRREAEDLLAELEAIARTTHVPPVAFAFAYVGLGDDRAFEWLEKAIDARDPMVTQLPSMPFLDVVRDDPRFGSLLARMHLA